MKKLSIIIFFTGLTGCLSDPSDTATKNKTYCNPVNISYRFMIDEPSRREAADPTVIIHNGSYYLFASKSGGYWKSPDLADWEFIKSDQIPTEEYAPTALSLDGSVYFLASSATSSTIYRSDDPDSGRWSVFLDSFPPVWDPAFFLDEDERLYLYWGCSNVEPICGIELDRHTLEPLGSLVELIIADPGKYGWEQPGDRNELEQPPWIEGAWMNKYNGKYYLQYASPGTEFKSYADAVYISDKPLGPYKIADHNPFSSRHGGFATGAGHGSTFRDLYGNYWHIATVTVSVKHMFERRISLFPACFDEDDLLYTCTAFGDYPTIIPDKKITDPGGLFAGWILLSYNKPAEVSSSAKGYEPGMALDEDIRTYWSAASGNDGEWLKIDLQHQCKIIALQVNFAEHGTEMFGRDASMDYRYMIEYSRDGNIWKILEDRSGTGSDLPHQYLPLKEAVSARYVKITNRGITSGNFALSGFRIFGTGPGEIPGVISEYNLNRDPGDRRKISISWNNPGNSTGYIVQYGIDSLKLYQDHMVYQDTSLVIRNLNSELNYYFSVIPFSEAGIQEEKVISFVE